MTERSYSKRVAIKERKMGKGKNSSDSNANSEVKKYWDSETVVGEIQKSEHSKIVVSDCEKDGKKFIKLTTWYNTKADDTFKPSQSINFEVGENNSNLKALLSMVKIVANS